jgi:putative peptide zinc metalloprotease protein
MILLTALLALAAVGFLPAASWGGEGDGATQNAAVAVNKKDGSSEFKFKFAITQTSAEVINHSNAAVAFASCIECETVAIAVQVVLVTGNPHTVTPQNIAVAFNELCEACLTFASAYQIVKSTGGPVEFTEAGRQRLNSIRKGFKDLRAEIDQLSLAELHARVEGLKAQLKALIDEELVPAADDDDGETAGGQLDENESEDQGDPDGAEEAKRRAAAAA